MSKLSQRPQRPYLECEVAIRFDSRPSLFDVAAQVLTEQWMTRGLADHVDPGTLFLVSLGPGAAPPCIRPLSQVLVERFCLRRTLNLTPDEDYLTPVQAHDPSKALTLDLHPLEVMINECGPFMLEAYQQAIVDFWGSVDQKGQTPWQWYSDYLQEQFTTALSDTALPPKARDAAQWLQAHPVPGIRASHDPSRVEVNNLRMDMVIDWQLDPELSSALLIEQTGIAPDQNVTLLYTPTGLLKPFASRTALLAHAARPWPSLPDAAGPIVHLAAPTLPYFQSQALGLLYQQLHASQAAVWKEGSPQQAKDLMIALDRLTSMFGLCSLGKSSLYQHLTARLPSWLKMASPAELIQYSTLITEVAQAYHDAKYTSWLDGVPDAQTFATQRLAARISADHPDANLDPASIRVVNAQATVAVLPDQETIVTDNTLHTETFTLPQLAISNLGLLRPGKVILQMLNGTQIPPWFDEHYLRRLITEADVAQHYPAMLRTTLLDAPAQRQHREFLLRQQLHRQLPALAMALHLEGKPIDLDISAGIGELFDDAPDRDTLWQLRAFGLLRTLDARPDLPLNTWLIEAPRARSKPCLLYRPLHSEPLLAFSDRQALLDAISSPGALQDDLLERLPEEDRKVYAYGGFLEPHLFYPLEDDWAVPFGKPSPATLATTPALSDPAHAIYQGCIDETISHFQAHARTSAQARWDRWKSLGWLLLNTALPFVPEPLAVPVWAIQLESAFLELVGGQQSRSPGERIAALVEFLLNLALLLLNHAYRGIELQRQETPNHVGPPPDLPSESLLPTLTNASPRQILDFSWANATRTLDTSQQQALGALRAQIPLGSLGEPIPSGPLQGLYLYQDRTWAALNGTVYQVEYDAGRQRPRIIDSKDELNKGPWLRQDEAGRWRLDLGLHLRGGMPLHKRIETLRADNKQALTTLENQIKDDVAYQKSQREYLDKAARLAHRQAPDSILRNYLAKLEGFSTFWQHHLERLNRFNTLKPLKQYKVKRAYALSQRLRCEMQIHQTLSWLHAPIREQVDAVVAQHQRGYDLTETDVQSLGQRIDTLLLVLDKLLLNSQTLLDGREQLERLASLSQPQILEYLREALVGWELLKSPLTWRWARIEAGFNRLTLLERLDEESQYWIEHGGHSIDLAFAQRQQLAELGEGKDEVASRLVASIDRHLGAARRQMDNLQSRLGPGSSAQATLERLQQDLDTSSQEVQAQLDTYAQIPAQNTVGQLRKQVPGLIETQEGDVLLGTVHPDDDTVVDVPVTPHSTSTRSYRLQNDRWVEIKPAAPARPALPHKLKHLLKDSQARLRAARQELQRLEEKTFSQYLPVELEELLHGQRGHLRTLRAAIEQQLTRDNQTDELSGDRDAARTIKDLEDLDALLTAKATELRTRAALEQKPRMAELRFLIAQGTVTIRVEHSRTLLARVKGKPADYLDDYGIYHGDDLLWVAHFHYRSADADKRAFVAGHLKTASQRYAQGAKFTHPDTGQTEDVLRNPISVADAQQYFFSL